MFYGEKLSQNEHAIFHVAQFMNTYLKINVTPGRKKHCRSIVDEYEMIFTTLPLTAVSLQTAVLTVVFRLISPVRQIFVNLGHVQPQDNVFTDRNVLRMRPRKHCVCK